MAGAFLPVVEKFAVAVGEAGGGVYVQVGEGLVDPGGGAFEFGVVADGGLVDDQVGEGFRPFDRTIPPVFFVDEGRAIT